jgi:hypothetical protein
MDAGAPNAAVPERPVEVLAAAFVWRNVDDASGFWDPVDRDIEVGLEKTPWPVLLAARRDVLFHALPGWRSMVGLDLIDAARGLHLTEINGSKFGLQGYWEATGQRWTPYGLLHRRYFSEEWYLVTETETGPRCLPARTWKRFAEIALETGSHPAAERSVARSLGLSEPFHGWDAFVDRAFAALRPSAEETAREQQAKWLHGVMSRWEGTWIFPTPVGDLCWLGHEYRPGVPDTSAERYVEYLNAPEVRAYHDSLERTELLIEEDASDVSVPPGRSMVSAKLDDLLNSKLNQRVLHPSPGRIAVLGSTRSWIRRSAARYWVVKPLEGMQGKGIRVVERAEILRDGVPAKCIAEPLVQPRRRHARCLRSGVMLELDASRLLHLFHIASYWRVNPRPFDPTDPSSVVTNLCQGAIPDVLGPGDPARILRWLHRWAMHLVWFWGLQGYELHLDFAGDLTRPPCRTTGAAMTQRAREVLDRFVVWDRAPREPGSVLVQIDGINNGVRA